MSDEEGGKTTKKEQREQLYSQVKEVIQAAGPKGVTATQIADTLGLVTGDADQDKGVLHEMRAVARNVCKKEGWSRINRDGRQKIYQAISEEEAQKQFDAEQAEREAEKERKKAEKKEAEDDDDSDDDDSDDDDSDEDDDDDE